jgi:hypothetical protein
MVMGVAYAVERGSSAEVSRMQGVVGRRGCQVGLGACERLAQASRVAESARAVYGVTGVVGGAAVAGLIVLHFWPLLSQNERALAPLTAPPALAPLTAPPALAPLTAPPALAPIVEVKPTVGGVVVRGAF